MLIGLWDSLRSIFSWMGVVLIQLWKLSTSFCLGGSVLIKLSGASTRPMPPAASKSLLPLKFLMKFSDSDGWNIRSISISSNDSSWCLGWNIVSVLRCSLVWAVRIVADLLCDRPLRVVVDSTCYSLFGLSTRGDRGQKCLAFFLDTTVFYD